MDKDLEVWFQYTKDIVKLDKTNSIIHENINPYKNITPQQSSSNLGAVLDLHGLTQEQAFERLKTFLINSSFARKSEVVIITGKGSLNQPGAIKLAVPRWLEYTELKQYILGYSEIIDKLGGSGSIRVVIKRIKHD